MRSLSGTIAAGGVAQSPAGAGRRNYLLLQNPSEATEAFWVAFGGVTATLDSTSIEVVPGATYIFEGRFIPPDDISVIAATTGTKFTIWEG